MLATSRIPDAYLAVLHDEHGTEIDSKQFDVKDGNWRRTQLEASEWAYNRRLIVARDSEAVVFKLYVEKLSETSMKVDVTRIPGDVGRVVRNAPYLEDMPEAKGESSLPEKTGTVTAEDVRNSTVDLGVMGLIRQETLRWKRRTVKECLNQSHTHEVTVSPFLLNDKGEVRAS